MLFNHTVPELPVLYPVSPTRLSRPACDPFHFPYHEYHPVPGETPSNKHMNPTQKSGKFPSRSFHGSVLCAALLALSNSAFAQTAAAPVAAPTTASDEVVKLSPFTVSTERDYGYRSANSISATRTNTPIKDVPVNIQVFGKELYEDVLANSQVDLEKYNASLINGISADSPFTENVIQQEYNAFLFRGFTQNWGLRDGVREYDPVDTQGLARVEIVKGPVAALYGVSYPGGVLNSVNKSVDYTHNFSRVRMLAGGEGGYGVTLDANVSGKLGDGKAGLRFNTDHQVTKDQRAHSEGSIKYYQMVASYQPTPTTEFTFTLENSYRGTPNGLNSSSFQRQEANPSSVDPDPSKRFYTNQAAIPINILRKNIPWDWNWSNGKNLRSLAVKYYKGAVTQQVGDNLSLTAYYQFNAHDQIDGNGWGQAGSSGKDGWGIGGSGWTTDSAGVDHMQSGYMYRDWTNTVGAYGATGVYKMDFTGVKNTFTFGGAAWAEKFITHLSQSAATIEQGFAPGSSVSVPYGPPADLKPMVDGTNGGYGHQNNANHYYFVALQSGFLDNRLKTNLALNRTSVKNVNWTSAVDSNPVSYTISKTSPMIGATFDVTKEITLFAVRGTSLFPNSARTSFGVTLPPVTGKSIEAGVKFETADGKLSGTVSYYTIDQEGGNQFDANAVSAQTIDYRNLTAQGGASIAIRNARYPLGEAGTLGDQVAADTANSKGIELDLNYQPTRNWAIQFSYANNNKTTVAKLNPALVGRSNAGSIKQQYSILTKYTFTDGAVNGLSLGIGFNSAGKALQDYQKDTVSSVVMARYNPSTVNVDLFSTYRFKAFNRNQSIQLVIKNATEQGYFTGWKATGSNKLATERYEVPVSRRFVFAYSIDL